MKVAFREQRQDEVQNAARAIYQEIKSICDAARGSVTVEAHKDGGRVLRIRSVGKFGITKFTYSGTPKYSGSVKTYSSTHSTRPRPGWLLIEKSKNGRPRTIPMSGRVRRVIERLCAEDAAAEYVFESIRTGRKIIDVKHGFTSACREAGIENLTFHDLRHTWSTRAAEMGVPEHVGRDIMGHSSQSMTGDYTHATPEAMEDAMERIAGYSVNYGKTTAKRAKRQGLR